jgi:arylsulfatase A-like enzyme
VEKYQRKAADLGLDRVDPLVKGELMSFIADRPRHVIRRMLQSDPVYAAMIENLDTNVGRVLDAVAAEGLADNTVVVFTSDNGGLSTAEGSPTCNLPLAEGKGWAEEGGNRVAQILRWPVRVAAGQHCDTPVTSTDFYPTFLEAAGLPLRPEQHADGVSLLPLLDGKSIDREALFWHYPHYSNQGDTPAGWVIAGDWKLVEHFEESRLKLYNLAADPSETNECGEANPAVRSRLFGLLRQWRDDVQAKIPQPNPDYDRVRPRVPNNAHE